MNRHSSGMRMLSPMLILALSLLIPGRSAVAQMSLDWPRYGNDQANTRFQNVDQINLTNAASLKVA